jgi:putative ABC transport system permease protein
VENAEAESCVYVPMAEVYSGEETVSMSLIYRNAEAERNIAKLKVIDGVEKWQGTGILVPYKFFTNYGFKAADKIKIKIGNEKKGEGKDNNKYEYTICGFYEDQIYGVPIYAAAQIFVLEDYKKVVKDLTSSGGLSTKATIYSVKTSDNANIDYVSSEIDDIFDDYGLLIDKLKTMQNSVILYPNLISLVLVLVAILLVGVSLLVCSFSISSAISDSTLDIGIWKACGWRDQQIAITFVIQYFITVILGSAAGIAISVPILPVVSKIVSSTVGLIWEIPLAIPPMIISSMLTIIMVVTIALVSSRKARKLLPVKALTNSSNSKRKRHNHLPLKSSKLGLTILLALKAVLNNGRQTFIIIIISAALVFSCSSSFVAYYNLGVKDDMFVNMVGYPHADINFVTDIYGAQTGRSINQSRNAFEKIKEMSNVAKTVGFMDLGDVDIGDVKVTLNVSDNVEALEKNNLVTGSYPKGPDEVALSFNVADKINKHLGDTVTIEINDKKKQFVISAITQQVYNMGMIADMTSEGFKRYDPGYAPIGIMIFLNDNKNASSFANNLEHQFSYLDKLSVIKVSNIIDPLVASLRLGVQALMTVLLLITLATILLITLVVITSTYQREKFNFGLYKAFGFSSNQLANQLSLYTVLPVIAGSIIGGIAGGLLANRLYSLVLPMVGIQRSYFEVNGAYLISSVIGVIVFSYIVANLMAIKVRHISACSFIKE